MWHFEFCEALLSHLTRCANTTSQRVLFRKTEHTRREGSRHRRTLHRCEPATQTGTRAPIEPVPTEGAVLIACRSRSPHSPPNAQQAGSAGSRATNWLRGRGAALLALNVCVGRWQRTCNWLDVHSRMFGQRCLPLTAALTSPRRCHNEAYAGGDHNILSAAERYTVAVARAAHALHARSDLYERVSRESASRSRPRVAHS